MIIKKLVGSAALAGTIAVSGASFADPDKMSADLAQFQAASEELIEIYAESKKLSARIVAVSKRRAEAEAAIEQALKTLNPQDPNHGKLAEEAFATIEAANRKLGMAHLEALEAETKAKHYLSPTPTTDQ